MTLKELFKGFLIALLKSIVLGAVIIGAMWMFAKCSHAQDVPNKIEQGLVGASFAADAITTRQMLARGNFELNPIARPFVQTNGGTIAYFSTSFAGVVWSNHRLANHPRIRHTFNWSLIALETYCAIHNTQLPRRHP